jgi:2-oxo-4-hydroxy-4-carboxy-5-ureidoimidazoline decarboxylase
VPGIRGTVDALHAAMQAVVCRASRAEQLALIRAHPELLGRLVAATALTDASRREQASAGLYECSQAQLERLRELAGAYRTKFAFPFIVAVRGLTYADIIARIVERLPHDLDTEFPICLDEIGRIAWLRLQDLLRQAGAAEQAR